MNRSTVSSLVRRAVGTLIVGVMAAVPLAEASALTVTSYSMNNGAHGTFNYRDFTYSNCAGVCDITNSSLSGGTGKLTDGVFPTQSWYQYGEATPWVGWDGNQGQSNPVVTFNFGGIVDIDSITVWVDNSIGAGGVWHPASISVDGINFLLPLDSGDPLPRAYTFSGLDIIGSSVTLQFSQQLSYPWLMVGEVSFEGATAVPEPTTLSLIGLALAGFGFSRRRQTHY
jgi:hypothetical protein